MDMSLFLEREGMEDIWEGLPKFTFSKGGGEK